MDVRKAQNTAIPVSTQRILLKAPVPRKVTVRILSVTSGLVINVTAECIRQEVQHRIPDQTKKTARFMTQIEQHTCMLSVSAASGGRQVTFT